MRTDKITNYWLRISYLLCGLFIAGIMLGSKTYAAETSVTEQIYEVETISPFTINDLEEFDMTGLSQEAIDQINVEKFKDYQKSVNRKDDARFAIYLVIFLAVAGLVFWLIDFNPLRDWM